jgi:DNA-binding NarL/FixJ family response regulator
MTDAKSILLIDSHDTDRHYYASRLRFRFPDYEILEATSGQAALDLCVSQSIDCVILELSLPDMFGLEVLIELVPNARQPQIPVVVLTSFEQEPLLEVARVSGAFAALRKHFASSDDLDQVVLRAIAAIPVDRKQTA